MTTATRNEFLAQFTCASDAIEFESQALSIGSEFLPECAVEVIYGGEPTAAYWSWLIEQSSALCPVEDES